MRFTDPTERPYFLWNQPTTVGEFRAAMAAATGEDEALLLGRLLREARDPTCGSSPRSRRCDRTWPQLERYLGSRRAFWRYLLDAWERHGLA